MIFTIGITLAVVAFSALVSMVRYYLPLMTPDTRYLWIVNIVLLGLRQLIALLQPVVTNLTGHDVTNTFKIINYCISILIAIWFMRYIHQRYSREYRDKYTGNNT